MEAGQLACTLGLASSIVHPLCASQPLGSFEDEINSGSAQWCQEDWNAGESALSIPVFPSLIHRAMTHSLYFYEWDALLVSSIPNEVLAKREALNCT